MNTAILGLAIVNASRFFGKLIADIFAILFHMPVHFGDELAHHGRGRRLVRDGA